MWWAIELTAIPEVCAFFESGFKDFTGFIVRSWGGFSGETFINDISFYS
jgi:hypothetical protein